MNVADIVKETAARLPDKAALIFQDKPITYGELERSIEQAAAGIASLGIRKGDRVGVLVHNIPHFVYAYLGIERAGGVMVPLNTMYTAVSARKRTVTGSKKFPLVVTNPCEQGIGSVARPSVSE